MSLSENIRAALCAIAVLLLMSAFSLASPAAEPAAVDAALAKIDAVIAQGPFEASWQSLESYQCPNWFRDAKFGIFIHWGPMSVPAFDDWYARNMYLQDHKVFQHHLETYGPQAKFGFKDFLPRFKAEKFDPGQYAKLFEQAGAKFVVPVAEHHDGFPLYDCSFTDWNAVKMGPRRDLVADLAQAVRRQGLHFGASSHRAENWWFYGGGRQFDSDVHDPRFAGLYGPAKDRQQSEQQITPPDAAFLNDWLARTCELVDNYQPEQVWFDWWIEQPAFAPYLKKFAAFYYNRAAQWKRGVVIAYKKEAFPERAAVLDLERGQLASLRPLVWQTDTSVSKNSWFHLRDPDYRTVDSLVDDLVDIVSKNGVLLLNIGPKADGSIPQPEQQRLLEVGRWLSVNGEAIYGSRPWAVFGEGPTQVFEGQFTDTKRQPFTSEDIRFTSKGATLYAVALAWPASGKLTIKSLAEGASHAPGEVTGVELLGSKAKLAWARNSQGLTIEMPTQKPCDHAFVFKIAGL